MSALTWPTDDGKGNGPDLVVDDGGDMTLLIHEGFKAEDAYAKDGSLPSACCQAMHVCARLVLPGSRRVPNIPT